VRLTKYEIEPGVWAHVPPELPPQVIYTRELLSLSSRAERALASLNEAARLFPHLGVMLLPSVYQEAVASVGLEGTRTTLAAVVEYSAQPGLFGEKLEEVEAWNYVHAMRAGFHWLTELPLSSRLLRRLHQTLLQGVRGKTKAPGEFRKQCVHLKDANYVPPPPQLVPELMTELEGYINDQDDDEAELVRCAIVHYQFEAIHPFLDGNGRMGRLLISLYLHARGLLEHPVLNLSQYLERQRAGYLDRLRAVGEESDWMQWISFFLRAVATQASERRRILLELADFYRQTRDDLERAGVSANTLRAVDTIFEKVVVTASDIRKALNVSAPSSYAILRRLIEAGLVQESPRKSWPQLYTCKQLLDFWQKV